jgi:hypothetical protein
MGYRDNGVNDLKRDVARDAFCLGAGSTGWRRPSTHLASQFREWGLDIFGRIRAGGARARVQRRDNAAIYLYALPGGRMITDRPLNNKHYKLVRTSTHVRKVLHLKSRYLNRCYANVSLPACQKPPLCGTIRAANGRPDPVDIPIKGLRGTNKPK